MNAVWGGSYSLTKWTLGQIPPGMLAVLRFAIGGGALLLVAPPLPRRPSWRDLGLFFTVGFFGIALAFVFHYGGIMRTTVTKAAIEVALEPIFLLGLAIAYTRIWPSGRTFQALLLSFVGTLLLVVGGKSGEQLQAEILNQGEAFGDLLVLVSVILGGVYTVFSKPLVERFGALTSTAWGCVVGMAFLLPLAAWEGMGGGFPVITPATVGSVLFLGLFCTAFGFALWNRILTILPMSQVAMTLNVQPLAGVLSGWLFLGESLGPWGMAGGAAILAGLTLARFAPDPLEETPGLEEVPA